MKTKEMKKDTFQRVDIVHRKKIVLFFLLGLVLFLILFGRLTHLCVFRSEYYSKEAQMLHERERKIKAARGIIYDRNGKVLAENQSVCTISVIHNQITDKESVIKALCTHLDLSEEYVRKRVEKYSSIEKIKSNVDKATGDKIRNLELPGVKVDEDYKRFYPYESLASKVIGFTGGDNQGIIGLEVIYEDVLKGTDGLILATTDARGVDLKTKGESRIEPISGNSLYLTMDLNIQSYATQLAEQAMLQKQAKGVQIIVMNCKNGEILAMTDVPEFNLNEPYTLNVPVETAENVTKDSAQEPAQDITQNAKMELLNKMWRNSCISDTYEPGSTFKIITAAAALEENVVTVDSKFSCPGFIMVEDRRIRCHKTTGHGGETFLQGTMNSCNPVFITLGLRLGAEKYYNYFTKFGLLKKTNVDLPGEAKTIMHKLENIGAVELATVSFGQSFQVTPMGLLTTVSSLINGGTRITPHIALAVKDEETEDVQRITFDEETGIVSEKTSETLRYILEQVVENGTGKNGYVEGFRIGGKTATSQTIPRGNGKYIASYIGFAPADDPTIIAIAIVEEPKGIYYGGQVAAPIVRQLFENILPYLEGMDYN